MLVVFCQSVNRVRVQIRMASEPLQSSKTYLVEVPYQLLELAPWNVCMLEPHSYVP